MRFILFFCLFSSFSVHSLMPDRINGTSLNRMDIIKENVSHVSLSDIDHFIVPEDWQMFFEDNSFRDLKVSANRGQGWHEAFDQIGKKLLLTILIDGSTKFIVIAKPFAEFNVGVQIINMRAISYSNNSYLEDVFKRAQVNELNYQNEAMRLKFVMYEQKREELAASMQKLKFEQEQLKIQAEKLQMETNQAMANAQLKQSSIDQKINSLSKSTTLNSQFVFYTAPGLVKSNIKKLAEKIGYSSVEFDSVIPQTCDWPQEKKEILQGLTGEKVISDYVNRYGMSVESIQNIAYLKFHGSVESFKQCSGIY